MRGEAEALTREDRRFCEKHPQEEIQYCSLCLRETRLATREECAELHSKMDAYREAVTGKPTPRNGDKNIP